MFVETSGINIREKFVGYDRRELPNFGAFLTGIQDCLLTNAKRLFTQVGKVYFLVNLKTVDV